MDLFSSKCLTVTKPVCSGKKMPRRTYITEEEKALPGHKPMKDRMTLATWKCKWGLQDQAITRVPLGESEGV